MDKQMLKCDICGGVLKMRANHEAVCEFCGIAYSIESLREKFNGLKVSVTGTRDDVAQWKELLNTYLHNRDYSAAESVVKKILEAVPTDQYANSLYKSIQEWKHYIIIGDVLAKCEGSIRTAHIPNGIKEIGDGAFRYIEEKNRGLPCYLEEVIIPEGVVRIGNEAFLSQSRMRSVVIPSSVKYIGESAFAHCNSLEIIKIPEGVEEIADFAFYGVKYLGGRTGALKGIFLPRSLQRIGKEALFGIPRTRVSYHGNRNLEFAFADGGGPSNNYSYN